MQCHRRQNKTGFSLLMASLLIWSNSVDGVYQNCESMLIIVLRIWPRKPLKHIRDSMSTKTLNTILSWGKAREIISKYNLQLLAQHTL